MCRLLAKDIPWKASRGYLNEILLTRMRRHVRQKVSLMILMQILFHASNKTFWDRPALSCFRFLDGNERKKDMQQLWKKDQILADCPEVHYSSRRITYLTLFSSVVLVFASCTFRLGNSTCFLPLPLQPASSVY